MLNSLKQATIKGEPLPSCPYRPLTRLSISIKTKSKHEQPAGKYSFVDPARPCKRFQSFLEVWCIPAHIHGTPYILRVMKGPTATHLGLENEGEPKPAAWLLLLHTREKNLTSAGVIRSDLFSRTRSDRASWLITRVAAASLESLPACSPPSTASTECFAPASPFPVDTAVGGGATSMRSNRGESHRHTTASRRTCSCTNGSAKNVCHGSLEEEHCKGEARDT